MNETTDKVSAATINVASNEEVTSTKAVEEWRPVVGWEGLYEVSSAGNVRYKPTGTVLAPFLNKGKHRAVALNNRVNGVYIKRTSCCVYSLVANAFLTKPHRAVYIVHVDGDELNDNASNLKWMTLDEAINTLPGEEWRGIENVEDTYEVSNMGRVRNIKTGVLLGQRKTHDGYYIVAIYYPRELTGIEGRNRAKNVLVSRLVAKAFIDRVPGKLCVDHIDGDRLNNKADNLRWVTHKENNNNPITVSRRHSTSAREKFIASIPHKRAVYCIELNKYWRTEGEAGKELGISQASISKECYKLTTQESLGAYSTVLHARLHFRFA